jgi:small nuclear ribonucleoprotein (snRNP)-like protein
MPPTTLSEDSELYFSLHCLCPTEIPSVKWAASVFQSNCCTRLKDTSSPVSSARLLRCRARVTRAPLQLLRVFFSPLMNLRAVELRNGEMYRGRLVEAEDNMSCQLSGIVLTGKDGKVTSLEQVCVVALLIISAS